MEGTKIIDKQNKKVIKWTEISTNQSDLGPFFHSNYLHKEKDKLSLSHTTREESMLLLAIAGNKLQEKKPSYLMAFKSSEQTMQCITPLE